jgi:hypothetical protein
LGIDCRHGGSESVELTEMKAQQEAMVLGHLLDYEAAKAAEERGAKENPVGDTGLARDPE